jgi:hypothetical protein
MELSFIFYLFSAFIIIPGTLLYLTVQKRIVAGVIASAGLLILYVLFGVQYFTVTGEYVETPAKMRWPPSINMCPDFLSLYTVANVPYCVDTAGVSTIPAALTKFNPANPIVGPVTPGNPNLFNLFTNLDGKARADQIKAECLAKGVTWEGVFDGTNLYTETIPKPA